MRIWRISNFLDLSGIGGTIWPGRWHEKGHHVVYCADHPSTSLLEIIVHATRLTVPDEFQLIEIDVPDDIHIRSADELPAGWEKDEMRTRRIGTQFLTGGTAALFCVPSVIMPRARNYLLNPIHADASQIRIVGSDRYPFDSRLLGAHAPD
jgi:RES domain-containing protein